MDSEKLEGMKYAELQKLAKTCGVRANMKADKLLKALQDYYRDKDRGNKAETSKNLSVPEVISPPKLVKRKRSVEAVKSPKTPVAKRLKIQQTPDAKNKGIAKKLQSPALIKATPTQLGKANMSTPGSLQRNHKRRGTYEKKNSPTKSGGKVCGEPSKRPRSQDKGSHKRTGTYDKVTGNQAPGTEAVTEGKKSSGLGRKHSRRSTYTKEEEKEEGAGQEALTQKAADTSPGIQNMISAMSDGMTQEQMKASLLTALDKRAKDKVPDAAELDEVCEGSQIPRYTALGKQRKPGTPSGKFESAHKKQFKKMESIDQWMDRKQQRSEALGASMKKMHMLTQQMRSAVENVKKYQTPPSLLKKTQSHLPSGKSKMSLFQSPVAKPFVPTVTSVSKADFKFLKSPKPAPMSATRKSPRLSGSGRENRPGNTSVLQNRQSKTGTTPFQFRGNTSMMNKSHNSTLNSSAAAKPKFNLQASLQRPVTWKTHKGKVKPLGTYNSLQVKNENRQKVQTNRSDRRLDMQMKRRGFMP